MKTGDLIFVKPTNLTGRLIAWFGRSEYSHVGICLNDHEIAEINLGYTFNIRPNTYTSYDLYRCIDHFDENDMINVIYGKIGLNYDILDIIKILFKLPLKNTPRKMICSEVVFYCYQLLGIELCKQKVPTPQNLIDGGKLYKVK